MLRPPGGYREAMFGQRPHRGPVGPPRPRGPRVKRPNAVDEISAGGLVIDGLSRDPQALLISRSNSRGRLIWSLPKGHIESGENSQQTAIREIGEETGITAEILEPLGEVDFWFMSDGRRIHKTVHHFLLVAVGGELSADDPEVDFVEWVPLNAVRRRLTHADERDLLRKVDTLLAKRVS